MTTWDVLTGSATVPSGAPTELAALRVALPGYEVTITSHSRAYRFEVIHRATAPALAASSAATPATFGGNWPGVPGRPPWTAIPFDRAGAGAPVGALAVPALGLLPGDQDGGSSMTA